MHLNSMIDRDLASGVIIKNHDKNGPLYITGRPDLLEPQISGNAEGNIVQSGVGVLTSSATQVAQQMSAVTDGANGSIVSTAEIDSNVQSETFLAASNGPAHERGRVEM